MTIEVKKVLEETKGGKELKFSFIPLWLRVIGIISAILYISFIGFVFGDYEYALVNFVFIAGAPLYVSWISNLFVVWLFKKQRKITGFLVLECVSCSLYFALIFVVYLIKKQIESSIFMLVGLFTITLIANMIIYPLLTFPRSLKIVKLNTEVKGPGNIVEY